MTPDWGDVAAGGAAAVVVSVLGGWGFVTLVLAVARVGTPAPRSAGRAVRRVAPARPGAPRRLRVRAADPAGVLRGGLTIGVLERAAVTFGVLVGHPDVIAVVVAVKGLGRFAELREHPAAAERFVIGSLASLLWAGAVGAAARWWLA